MLLHYLKITFRNIAKNKFRYVLTTLGIAVGMVIFSIMFFFADGFNDKWDKMPDEEQLAIFKYTTTDTNGNVVSNDQAINSNQLKKVLTEPLPDVETIAIKGFGEISYISEENKPEFTYKTKVMVNNKAFVDLAAIQFVKGGISDSWDTQNLAIIDEELATKLFGNVDNAVGKRLEKRFSDNSLDKGYTVCGVIKKVYSPMYGADMYTSLNFEERHYVQGFARFKKGSDMQQYNSRIKAATLDNKGGSDFLQLVPYTGQKKNTMLYVGLLLMGSLVLIVALMNFTNLLLTSMQLRIRQFTLRKIVGANSWTFMLMMLCEILPILIAATFLCYLMMELLLNGYQSSTFIPLKMREEIDGFLPLILSYPVKIAGWTLLGCMLLSGILVRKIQKSIVKQGIHRQILKANKNTARNILLFFQLMLTLIFLNVSVYLYQSIRNAVPEFFQSVSQEQSEAMLVVPLHQLTLSEKFDEINNRIKSIPGVISTTNEYKSMDDGVEAYDIISIGKKEFHVETWTKFDGYDTFWETKDPVFKRNLAPDEVIINRTLSQKIANDSLDTFMYYDQPCKVVGVVDDIPCTDSKKDVILVGAEIWYEKLCLVKCTLSSAKEVKKEILNIIREFLPETIDYNINSLYDEFRMQSRIMQVILVVLAVATAFSIILSMLGIYTAVSNDTKRKRKDIAIRKINGAKRRDIAKQFARLYTVLLVLAGITGTLLSHFIVISVFDSVEMGTMALRILTDIIVWLLLVVIVVLTIFVQIQKAVNEAPAKVIKLE